jgi:hypothetical protein
MGEISIKFYGKVRNCVGLAVHAFYPFFFIQNDVWLQAQMPERLLLFSGDMQGNNLDHMEITGNLMLI